MRVQVDTLRSQADADRIVEIFLQRPGSHPEKWELVPKGETYVARNLEGRIVAFAVVRWGTPTVVDHLEAERVDGHATVTGIAGMRALGEWVERHVMRCGGGRIVAMVHTENEEHQAALRKVGYSPRVVAFAKDVLSARSEAV